MNTTRKNKKRTGGRRGSRRDKPERRGEDAPARPPRDRPWSGMPDDADWDQWVRYLAKRSTPLPLHALPPSGGAFPLQWCVPEEYEHSSRPRLLKQLGKVAGRRLKSPGPVAARLATWLADAERCAPEPLWALECLAWCHALPRLAESVAPATWKQAVVQLSQTAQGAAALELESDPLTHQLLAGELPLTLAYLFPEFQALRDFRRCALRALSSGLVELTDGEGLVNAGHLHRLRPLLSCWTRCVLLADAAQWKGWEKEARIQYEWLTEQALRLTRTDGTQVLTNGRGGAWCAGCFATLLDQSEDAVDWELGRRLLPGRRFRATPAQEVDLPAPSVYSEWSELAVLRSNWKRKSAQVAVAFDDRAIRLELSCHGQVVISGDCTPRLLVDGQPVDICSDWSEVCWNSDDDVDYLELEAAWEEGCKVQRQILLARHDDFFWVADAVLAPRTRQLEYAVSWPLADGVQLHRHEPTWDGVLASDRPLAVVLPLGLPEWRAATQPAAGSALETDAEQNVLHLRQTATAQRLFAPLFFELRPRRCVKQRTWRQLTIAEKLVIQPAEVAAGFRVQSGKAQWIFYRSLAPPANRTVCGMNTGRDFVAARLLAGGLTEPLLEIE